MSKNINFPYISYFTKNLYVTTKLMNMNSYYITYFIPFFSKEKEKSFILRIKIIIILNLISIQQIKRVLPISMERQTPTFLFYFHFFFFLANSTREFELSFLLRKLWTLGSKWSVMYISPEHAFSSPVDYSKKTTS